MRKPQVAPLALSTLPQFSVTFQRLFFSALVDSYRTRSEKTTWRRTVMVDLSEVEFTWGEA